MFPLTSDSAMKASVFSKVLFAVTVELLVHSCTQIKPLIWEDARSSTALISTVCGILRPWSHLSGSPEKKWKERNAALHVAWCFKVFGSIIHTPFLNSVPHYWKRAAHKAQYGKNFGSSPEPFTSYMVPKFIFDCFFCTCWIIMTETLITP